MKTFEVAYKNQPWRTRRFKVIGVCRFDVLNPCWDGRKNWDGKHWSGDDACDKCKKEAAK